MKPAAAFILLLALPAPAEDDLRIREGEARYQASEARSACRGILAYLDGVGSVNFAGSGTDYRLIVVVRDHGTQRQARELLRGDTCGGVKILWSVSNPAALPPPAAPPPSLPPPAIAASRPPTVTPPTPPAARPPRPLPPTSCAPSEPRRTFYAGPVVLTPPRRYYDGGPHSANCSPSRYGLLAGGCPPHPCRGGSSYAANFSSGGRCATAPPPRPAAVCQRPGRGNAGR